MKRAKVVIVAAGLLSILFHGPVAAQEHDERYEPRNFLTSRYDRQTVAESLVAADAWVPYPAYSDRAEWAKAPQAWRVRYIREGERYLDHTRVSVPATAYLEYNRTGDRYLQQRYLERIIGPLRALFMAELIEGEGRFMDQILNGVWALCENSYWGSLAHIPDRVPDVREPYIDLGAARTGHLLAWIHYFLHEEMDAANPLITQRLRNELRHRILEPYYERTDFWWMGFEGSRMYRLNNWTPYCNSHVLAVILLMETDRERQVAAVHKLMDSLDRFINCYPQDGGCEEGPSYWRMAAASLYETLHMLNLATQGRIDIFDEPLIRRMGRYICKVNISYPWFYNYADGGAKPDPSAFVVYQYGQRVGDEDMQAFGAFLAQQQQYVTRLPEGSPFMVLEALFDGQTILEASARQPRYRDVWLEDLQIMAARDWENSDKGFYFAAKGGHNGPWNHNHNDVGSFILYCDGEPLVIDVGVKTYTAQTFSGGRYALWTMQSAWHNLPVINGVMQRHGREFEASQVDYRPMARMVRFSLDIAGAYPESARVKRWHRAYSFSYGSEQLLIDDEYELTQWVEPFYHTFVTHPQPVPAGPGVIEWTMSSGKKVSMRFPADDFEPRIETVELDDPRLMDSWGERVYRVVLTAKHRSLQGSSRIVISR